MFTKQHYEKIAEIIRENSDDGEFEEHNYTILQIYSFVDDLSDFFAEDNPNFNRKKFLKACGL